MPKKDDDDDDFDPNLKAWKECGDCEGWHTLIYMLKTKLIKVEGKKDGGEGPAAVRAMSPFFQYKKRNFTANLDGARKQWKEKAKVWKKCLKPALVDPAILAMAAAAGYESSDANDDDDVGGTGLDDLDENFGGIDIDAEDCQKKKAAQNKGDKSDKNSGKKKNPNANVDFELPLLVLEWSYVSAYIENPRTATVAIDVTDDSIYDPKKFDEKFWKDAAHGPNHTKVVAHNSAIKDIKDSDPRKRIVKKCRIELPFDVEMQWNPDTPKEHQLVLLKFGVQGSQEQFVVMEMKEARPIEFRSQTVPDAWESCFDDEDEQTEANDSNAEESNDMSVDRENKKRKGRETTTPTTTTFVFENEHQNNIRDFLGLNSKGATPMDVDKTTTNSNLKDPPPASAKPAGAPKDDKKYGDQSEAKHTNI
ncbi:hypothetical protein FisN_2Lu362 [Fistulifera solaris]|uniref:Uncharacterized protein n=1 Tax=Fistulifera solaris TaxID=1519565 RepID=A0A1Z5J7Z0_FISSO|nr:hypothetical protein FisN_2Lu362 [Fistulifera solaris]|eukprot:GAX10090.1 hypothetical protein FisN_2Lu362 [Fistulifera solaris]